MKDSGPSRPMKQPPPMPNFEHKFDHKKDICIRCKRTIYDARTRICDADAPKPKPGI